MVGDNMAEEKKRRGRPKKQNPEEGNVEATKPVKEYKPKEPNPNDPFDNLYQYVKIEIMKYEDKILPKYMTLRLLGLAEGKFVSNNNTASQAMYSFEVILLTFKLNRNKINSYLLANKSSFNNEAHKFNGIMRIIESSINDTVHMLERKEQSESKINQINTDVHESDGAEYKRKGKINQKLKGLM